MKEALFSYAGRAPKVTATKVIALYDPKPGASITATPCTSTRAGER